MQEADPTCTKDIAEKFNQYIIQITKTLSIEDDRSNIVDTLMKIEARLNFLCEAREFLNKKDLSTFAANKTKTLEQYERDFRKEKGAEKLQRKIDEERKL